MVLLVNLEFSLALLTVVKQNVNDLLVSRITIFAEHDTVQTCVAFLTLGVDISPDFDKFTHSLHVFIDYSKVQGCAPILVFEVELVGEVGLCHLANIVNIVAPSCLQYIFLLWL